MLDEASKQRVKELCDSIAKEQDPHRFSSLLVQLNQVLDGLDPASNKDGKGELSSSSSKRPS